MALGEVHLHPALVDQRLAVVGRLRRRPGHDVLVEGEGQAAPGGQPHPLVVELRGDHAPALVLLPHPVGHGDAHVVVEGLRRREATDRVDDRPLEARRRRRHAQDRDALVLGDVGIGAHGQPDVVGLVGTAGEDLGPVDHVLLAVTHRPRAQRGQVGARLGLGVADGEVDLARQDLGQEEGLLLIGAETHDGRPHRVDGDEGKGGAGAPRLVEEDELVGRRPTLPAELGRPSDAQPAVLADLAHDLAPGGAPLAALGQAGPHLFGQQLGVVGAQLGAQLLLFGAFFEEHRWQPRVHSAVPARSRPRFGQNCNTFSFWRPGRRLGRCGGRVVLGGPARTGSAPPSRLPG